MDRLRELSVQFSPASSWCPWSPRKGIIVQSPLGGLGNFLRVTADKWSSEDSNLEFSVYLGLTACCDAQASAYQTNDADFPCRSGIRTWLRGGGSLPQARQCTWWPAVAPTPGGGGAEPRRTSKTSRGVCRAPSWLRPRRVLPGLCEINHEQSTGGSRCGEQTPFSQLCPVQLQLVVGRQVVGDGKSLRVFVMVCSYDFHRGVKESLTKQLKLLKVKKAEIKAV